MIFLADEITGSIFQTIIDWCLNTGVKLVISIIVLIITFNLINFIASRIEKRILEPKKKDEKKDKTIKIEKDKTLIKTGIYVGKVVLKILIVISIIGYLGIDTSAFASLIASLGVCVGLAVNGALANIAGGVLILITRPFKLDDYIQAGDYSGNVEKIQLVFTVLKTPDNKLVYVPNGTLSALSIINYSAMDTRRVDLTFSVSYSTDIEFAKKVIQDTILKNEKVLKDIPTTVRLLEQGDSALNIATRVYCKNADYWDVYFDLQEQVLKALNDNNIDIPFNQLDVHVTND